MTKIREVTSYLESLAPLSSQETYDNCGLIVGDPNVEVNGVLLSLDCIEKTVEEAVELGCNLIIAHHPIVFKGLKKINGSDYIQRTVIKAIKNDIAIYAIHTNLDNYRFGVNYEIGSRLGLKNLRILSPKSNILNKITCFVPNDHLESVSKAMFDAGAGTIGDYSNCGFSSEGVGTFLPNENAKPFEGENGKLSKVTETRFEVVCSRHTTEAVISAMIAAHPYEEVAYDISATVNSNPYQGSGMVGELEKEVDETEFLNFVKKEFKCGVIRHTDLMGEPIKKVAFCGGAGSFLLNQAKKSKADIFITGDYKYHEFFDAEGKIVIADIGHFESEQFTSKRIASILKNKFTTFALHLTVVNTNPINYF
tara:strand:+ start:121505 stop:122602 length:1098 start_codon:yes stop_codon:yes gene_type:complete